MSKVSTFMKKAAVLRKNKTLRMYRNFFMTQLAFFVFTIIALTVKAEEGIHFLFRLSFTVFPAVWTSTVSSFEKSSKRQLPFRS